MLDLNILTKEELINLLITANERNWTIRQLFEALLRGELTMKDINKA